MNWTKLAIGAVIASIISVSSAHAGLVRVGDAVGAVKIPIGLSPEESMVKAGIPEECRMQAHEVLQNRIAYTFDTGPGIDARMDILCEFIPAAKKTTKAGVPEIGTRGRIGGLRYLRWSGPKRNFTVHIFDRTKVGKPKKAAWNFKAIPFFTQVSVPATTITPNSALTASGATGLSAVMRSPLAGNAVVTSHVNPNRRHPVTGEVRAHRGTDYGAACGTPVYAAANGVVTRVAFQAGGAGNYVVLRHDRATTGIDESKYFHLQRPSTVSGYVRQGDLIGYVGNTGIGTGCHLHFEVWRDGRYLDATTMNFPPASGVPELTPEQQQAFVQRVEADELARATLNGTLAGEEAKTGCYISSGGSRYPILCQDGEGDGDMD